MLYEFELGYNNAETTKKTFIMWKEKVQLIIVGWKNFGRVARTVTVRLDHVDSEAVFQAIEATGHKLFGLTVYQPLWVL